MRNILAFLMALLLTVAGLGWYLGWYKLQVTPGQDGTTSVNLKVDNVKTTQDAANILGKASDLAHQLAEKESKDKTKAEGDKNTTAPQSSKQPGGWFAN